MKIAMLYLVPTRDTSISYQTRYRDLYEEIAFGNDNGWEAVWITEHHFSNYGYTPSPMVLLTKAAEVAPNLRLGTAIIVLPLWNPIRLVEDINTLDVLSDGRVDLGIGRGGQHHEFRGYGTEVEDNRAVFQEAVDVVLRAWEQEDFTYEGEHFHVKNPVTIVPGPLQQPHPPIWMATTSPDSIRYAAAHGFHFMTGTGATPPELETWRAFIAQCLAQEGRNPEDYEYEANRFVFCSTSRDEIDNAIEQSRWQIRTGRVLYGGGSPSHGVGEAPPYPGEPDIETWRQRMVIGTPDEVLGQLERLAKLGITYIGGEFQFGGLSHEQTMKSLRLFAKDVMPVAKTFAPVRTIASAGVGAGAPMPHSVVR